MDIPKIKFTKKSSNLKKYRCIKASPRLMITKGNKISKEIQDKFPKYIKECMYAAMFSEICIVFRGTEYDNIPRNEIIDQVFEFLKEKYNN